MLGGSLTEEMLVKINLKTELNGIIQLKILKELEEINTRAFNQMWYEKQDRGDQYLLSRALGNLFRLFRK